MNRCWIRISLCLMLVSSLVRPVPLHAQDPQPVRIGIVRDGTWERSDDIEALFSREIRALLSREFAVEFPANAVFDGGWTLSGVQAGLDQVFSDSSVDIVLAMGVLTSAEVARRTDLPVPVIAPFVFDPSLQDLPHTPDGTSGVPNLNYLAHPASFGRDIRLFQDVAPFDRLAVLLTEAYMTGAPELWAGLRAVADSMGVDVVAVPVGESTMMVLEALSEDIDAVYVMPLTQLPLNEFDILVNGLIARRLPSFSFLGVEEVRRGLLVGVNPEEFWLRLARRVALNTQRVLLGEEPGSISVAIAYGEQLTINDATARAIGVSPPWSVVTEAELLSPPAAEPSQRLSLADAVRIAVNANLDLAVADFAVAAGAQDVRAARSNLLPHIDVSALGTTIDADRAEASFGSQPQRTLVGSANATQLIFSEPAWSNVSIQGHLQQAREVDRERLRLDVILSAAAAYLNVLGAQTFERIQRENVQLTRANLQRARVRQLIGVSNPSEVYRWESQIASGRRAAIDANAQRNIAEMELNRVMHRPLEESFVTVETGLDDESLVTGDPRYLEYFRNRSVFRSFRSFLVQEAVENAPELEQVDAAIAAQRRAYRSASNSFWSPTVALSAGVSNRFAEGGAGTDFTPQFPPGIPDLSGLFPQVNELNLSLGLSVSLPVFSGGSRFVQRSQAREELEGLTAQRDALAERIEQRIRSALHRAGSSFAGIGLAQDGADAARNNLDLVTDSYARGVVSVVELLDAQNAALVADLAAATAVYTFLLDIMEVERAGARFSFFLTEAEREGFFDRLEAFVAANTASR
jgi:outer membrane protein TolC